MTEDELKAERTPEQKEAIAARLVRLLEERDADEASRRNAVRRRTMDVEATLKYLVSKKIVSASWHKGISSDKLHRMVALTCIAKDIECVSKYGSMLNLNPVADRRQILQK